MSDVILVVVCVEALCAALVETDVDGLYSGLVRALLTTLFHLQDEQSKEEKETRGVGRVAM